MSKERAIQSAQKEINNLNAAILFMSLLPEFDGVEYTLLATSYGATVTANLPFDIPTYIRFRRAMGKGWKCGTWLVTQHDDGSIHRHITFKRGNSPVNLSISLCPEMMNATCHIEQTGVKEVPIFEIVCD